MHFLYHFLTVLLGGIFLQVFFPWYSIVIISFIAGILFYKFHPLGSFFSGFFGIALVWWGYSLFLDYHTQSILSVKIAPILKVSSPLVLVIVTGVLGGLVGGLSSLTAKLIRGNG